MNPLQEIKQHNLLQNQKHPIILNWKFSLQAMDVHRQV